MSFNAPISSSYTQIGRSPVGFKLNSSTNSPGHSTCESPSSIPGFFRWNHPSPPPSLFTWGHPPPPLALSDGITLLRPQPFYMRSPSSTPGLFRWDHPPPPYPPPPPFQITSLSFTSPPAFSFSLTRTKTVSCIACTLLLNLKFTFNFLPSSSPATNKVADQRMEPNLQSSVSESDRLMIEACPFSQFKREHPLEQWTVGSLPNLTLSWKSQGKRYSKLIKMQLVYSEELSLESVIETVIFKVPFILLRENLQMQYVQFTMYYMPALLKIDICVVKCSCVQPLH